jgi:hypothetical protein
MLIRKLFKSIIKVTVVIASLIVITEKVLKIIDFIIENNKLIAVIVRSPPDNKLSGF